MRYVLLGIGVLVLGVLTTASAEEPPDPRLAPVGVLLGQYSDLVNERQFDRVSDVFTKDVDYRSDSWIHVQGCKAIADALREAIKDKPALKLTLEPGAVRRVSADVVLLDGRWSLKRAQDEPTLHGGLTATCVREGAGWKIAALRDWNDQPDPRALLFEELSWLQGSWKGTSMDVPFTVKIYPTPGGGFLHIAMEFGANKDDVTGLSTIIGLDASTRTIRSWHFLNDGASGEGTWKLGENAMEGNVRLVTRTGEIIESARRLSLQKDGQLLMETTKRTIGTEVLAPLDPVRLQRVPETKGAAAPEHQ
jgi:ketosteroid isomerase-like protein